MIRTTSSLRVRRPLRLTVPLRGWVLLSFLFISAFLLLVPGFGVSVFRPRSHNNAPVAEATDPASRPRGPSAPRRLSDSGAFDADDDGDEPSGGSPFRDSRFGVGSRPRNAAPRSRRYHRSSAEDEWFSPPFESHGPLSFRDDSAGSDLGGSAGGWPADGLRSRQRPPHFVTGGGSRFDASPFGGPVRMTAAADDGFDNANRVTAEEFLDAGGAADCRGGGPRHQRPATRGGSAGHPAPNPGIADAGTFQRSLFRQQLQALPPWSSPRSVPGPQEAAAPSWESVAMQAEGWEQPFAPQPVLLIPVQYAGVIPQV
ncbi:hypothetical protein BESB_066200 [Besnoitia besnoiti]|uniref:Transmembrane protein n=1 Tax=Besnoitia besnoiti TaxID=94643 RepID=A0A2A9MG55_BESBE|nr:hypothetical protein BESB_066200 [Besnoitia besnoiti]PFH34587.1 hypothetical protein BESB_066200 [Besnoitia besnoiti]